ncbi:ferredoxin [Marmoricola endophyticus]|uniref:Ferredoxin n=1 Tax=Marmoricola endophyticus TaxID=2040280 RepID=A0A917F4S6_9ACTN|nr:ferredoxin [Marmoricola endophyticus]GGF46588.1 ferredoxin [Marmoricola endophyticus]
MSAGRPLRVEADADVCVGSGQCVMTAPEVFDQDDDASVVVLEEHPTADQAADVDAAAVGCPVQAIVLHEEP